MIPGASLTRIAGPAIARDEHSAPFYDALRREELIIRRCVACGHLGPPQAMTCSVCGGIDLTWQNASGAASLVAWSVVHSAPHRALRDQVPFATGYVELAEGPWLPARLVGSTTATLRPDLPLAVAFVHPTDGESYPVFMPRAAQPAATI